MRKNATRAIRRMALPPDLYQHALHAVIENDRVFQSNMRCTIMRAQQRKINAQQFRSIRNDLIGRAIYRYLRHVNLPCALTPRLHQMVVS